MVDDEGHVVVEAGQGGRFLGCTASLDLEAEEGQELLDAVEVGGLLLGGEAAEDLGLDIREEEGRVGEGDGDVEAGRHCENVRRWDCGMCWCVVYGQDRFDSKLLP